MVYARTPQISSLGDQKIVYHQRQPPSFWKWTSGVHKDKKAIGRECPAYKQDGECKDCRACWSRSIKQVSYKEH